MIKALITVYNPSADVRDNIFRIAQQVDEVIICDNSPHNNEPLLNNPTIPNLKYVFFQENLGLSLAFNRILKSEGWKDSDYVIFFDQDSSIADHHIGGLIEEYEKLKKQNIPVGCLGPVFHNTSNDLVEVPHIKTKLNDHCFKVSSIITSSMLCRYEDIRSIQYWNERVFLDMADWDFTWRMMKNGKCCCMTDAVILKHSLGTGERQIGPLRIRIGSVFREYYQTRECLYLLTRSYTPFKYRIRFLAMLSIRPLIHLLFLEHRRERIKYIFMGIRDFFKKKTGALK